MKHHGLSTLWAKSPTGEGPFQPLLHHMVDAAAAALAILDQCRVPWLAVPPTTLAFLVGLHDLGKATRNFQAQRPDLWPAALGPTPSRPLAPEPRHEASTFLRLSNGLIADWVHARILADWNPLSRRGLLRAIAFHHGRPRPSEQPLATCDVCDAAAMAMVQTLHRLLDPPPIPVLEPRDRHGLAWWLAGLTILADWLASNQAWFPPCGDAPPTPEAHWETARRRAHDALVPAGLRRAPVGDGRMASLFPAIEAPSPLQGWANEVPLPEGPQLVVIEDVTGAGKTEAALLLAQRLLARDGGGVFVAMPTMATANAIHARLEEVRSRFFAPGVEATLVLAHARSGDHVAFAPTARDDAAAEGSAWLAQDRRRCFLAPMGAGTVDQALLAVLPVRHAMLRLFGLSSRVLVVDEAHAYDAYMRQELSTLLHFQAALGGSAILLSATLPRAIRGELLGAYAKGLGVDVPAPACTRYPLATTLSRAGLAERACGMRPGLARRVMVERVPDAEAAARAVLEAARSGAAVAWIRNTVKDVLSAAEALRAAGAAPLVFHARFAMGDRLAIEDEVLRRFGKHASEEVRRGRIVLASQVLECSLDVDFDLLVSDLAPADLVIQRAGRLWRHARSPRPVAGPRMLLVSPEPEPAPPPDWPGPGFQGTTAVYRHRALLWRSARALLAAEGIETPGNIRELVEAAYGDETPPGLARDAERAEGNDKAASGQAQFNLLRFSDAYGGGPHEWPLDHRVPTRLGEPSVLFRLGCWEGGSLRPMVEAGARSWSMSEVVVRETLISGTARDTEAEPALAELRAGWFAWERDIPVIALRPDGAGGWTGRAQDKRGRELQVGYRKDQGLIVGPAVGG